MQNHIDLIQLILVIASVAGFLYFFVMRLEKDIGKLESNIGKISDKLDHITNRLDNDFRHLTAMQSSQSKRTDELYNVIIDMLKKGK